MPSLRHLAVLGYDLCCPEDYHALVNACEHVQHLAVHASFTPMMMVEEGGVAGKPASEARKRNSIRRLEGALYVNGGVDQVHNILLTGHQITSLELQHVHYANVKFSFLDSRLLLELSLRAVTLDDGSAASLARSLLTLKHLKSFSVFDLSIISMEGMEPIATSLATLPALEVVYFSVDIALEHLRTLLSSSSLLSLKACIKRWRSSTITVASVLPALAASSLNSVSRHSIQSQLQALSPS
jgi:hypothetical protein